MPFIFTPDAVIPRPDTRRLTAAMFEAGFARARKLVDA